MEIINIEARTYEAMMQRFEGFIQRVNSLVKKNESLTLKDWLDNQDVCEILNVHKKTLQSFRDTGKLEYTKIGNKIYYSPEAVKEFIEKHSITKGGNDGTE